MKTAWIVTLNLLLLGGGAVALAHHSYAMFDRDKKLALTGTVKEFRWSNPHAWMEIYVPNDKGGTDMWGVEMNSPNNLVREGWTRTTITPGDKVQALINPLRDGKPGGVYVGITLPSGKYIGAVPAKTAY